MKRFDPSNKHEDGMAPRTDGEWVRYSDHVEAMKRIAGEGERITPIAASFCRAYDEVNGPIPRAAAPAAPVAQGLTLIPMENVQRIHDLACEGMSHGLLADDKCREILEVLATPNAVTEPLQGTQEPSASAQQAETAPEGLAMLLANAAFCIENPQSVPADKAKSIIDKLLAASEAAIPVYAAPAPTQGTQEPSASAGEADRKAEWEAFSDWAWKKEGEPVGRMEGQDAVWAGWWGRAQRAAQPPAAAEADKLTDAAIARAISAWFDDYGIEENFEQRMRNAIDAAMSASKEA